MKSGTCANGGFVNTQTPAQLFQTTSKRTIFSSTLCKNATAIAEECIETAPDETVAVHSETEELLSVIQRQAGSSCPLWHNPSARKRISELPAAQAQNLLTFMRAHALHRVSPINHLTSVHNNFVFYGRLYIHGSAENLSRKRHFTFFMTCI